MTDPTGEEGLISMMIGIGLGRGAIETQGAVNQGDKAANLHIANLVKQSMFINYFVSVEEEGQKIGTQLRDAAKYQVELMHALYKTADTGFTRNGSKVKKMLEMFGADMVQDAAVEQLKLLAPGVFLTASRKLTGFPNFTDYMIAAPGEAGHYKTFIRLLGTRSKDFTASNNKFASPSGVGRFKHQGVGTWHHHEVAGVMMLVDTAVHIGYGHPGGGFYYDQAYDKDGYTEKKGKGRGKK